MTLKSNIDLENQIQHQLRDTDLADIIHYLKTQELPADNREARTLLLMIDNYYLNPKGILFYPWSPTSSRRKNPKIPTCFAKEPTLRDSHLGT